MSMKNNFLLIAVILLMPGVAMAQAVVADGLLPVNDVTQRFADPNPELLYRVAGLVETGQFEQARKLLTSLRMHSVPHLEVLFLSGRIYAGNGDFHSAENEFRLMLARDATLIRPRLELAYALFMDQDYDGASYHFQQVTAGELPDEVRAKVQGFLSAIREQLPRVGFAMDIVNDSNPKQSTNSKTVTIGGRSYLLSTTAPDKKIWGVLLNANANIPLQGNPSWFASVNASLTDYPNQDSDQLYLQTTAGKRFAFDNHTLSLEAGGHFFDFQGRRLYDGSVWRVSEFWRQGNRSSWQGFLQGAQQNYVNYTYQNGWQYMLSLENQFAQTANSRWQTGASYSRNQTRELPYAFSSPSVYVRYVHEWQGGIISGIRLQKMTSDYWGDDPFFGLKRRDSEQRIELDLLNRNWQINEFAPRLLIGLIEHSSNMPLYAFRRNYVRVGVSREF